MSTTTLLDYKNNQMVKRICIVNRLDQAQMPDNEILASLRQIQEGLKNEFQRYYGFSGKLYYCPRNVTEPPTGYWNMFLLDTADQAGALGYHDTNQMGMPQGKIFVKTAKDYGAQWSITLDHEVKEALVDPWGMMNFFDDPGNGIQRLVAYEACDAVEADKYGYKRNDIGLSNFITPYWTHPFNDTAEMDAKVHYDMMGQLKHGFDAMPGCHLSYYYMSGGPNGQNGWIDKGFNKVEFKTDNIKDLINDPTVYKLGDEIKIFSPVQQLSEYDSKWHICFKTPDADLVSKHGITKDEVKNAIDMAFNPPPGSRRDIRFKMSTGGINALEVNNVKDPLIKIQNSQENIYPIDKSFEDVLTNI